jgi:TonB family protein
MHKRIHPSFYDWFLKSLDALPASDPMNDRHLVTRLEVVISGDGRIEQLGVIRTSGVTAFDIAVLDALDLAQPFGRAPSAIASSDGNVYMWWEFHRNEVYGCSAQGARPFLLRL